MFLEFARGQLIELFSGGKNILPSAPDPIGYLHFCLLVDDLEQASNIATMNEAQRKFSRAEQRIAFITPRGQHRADADSPDRRSTGTETKHADTDRSPM
jgi:hypothetical protein